MEVENEKNKEVKSDKKKGSLETLEQDVLVFNFDNCC